MRLCMRDKPHRDSTLKPKNLHESPAGITGQTEAGTEQSAKEPSAKDAEPENRPSCETIYDVTRHCYKLLSRQRAL